MICINNNEQRLAVASLWWQLHAVSLDAQKADPTAKIRMDAMDAKFALLHADLSVRILGHACRFLEAAASPKLAQKPLLARAWGSSPLKNMLCCVCICS
jgi:hypothetical protein